MNFPNWRFSSPSIREYQTSKRDSGPRKKRPEPKPILHEPKVFPQSTSCQNQKHCKDHGLIASAHHENVLNPRISKRKHIFTWLKNFTCLMLAHVLDDYPKSLDHVFDVLRIEKPFDYFFIRFDVVSLVVLTEHDKHDHFTKRASNDGGNDVPQSTDQSMEPAQHGVQDVLNISTEVHVFHRTGQTDRVVYWTVPYTSGKELWLEPWPDDRSDRTGACLSCQTSQAKAEGQARINLG
ncbi:hypothetical protein YC2023_059374 [Brassica napus]